jgi:anti-sigma-K factor RskA
MNIQEYISSGILEAYVMGHTTPEECREVEEYATQYPEIKRELQEIEDAMNAYATEHSIAPPPHLKEKILNSIPNLSPESKNQVNNNVVSINRAQPTSYFSYWSVAASFLFIISTAFALYFWNKSTKMDDYMDKMAKINASLSDSIKSVAANITQLQNDMAILKDPMYKVVELKGQKAAPDAKAMVCWCPEEKKVYVEVDKLPAAPAGMQYQLWAIVDGKPVNEGMLTDGKGMHRMLDVDNAQAFAVTLEKAGGSPTPHGDMYVMGALKPS